MHKARIWGLAVAAAIAVPVFVQARQQGSTQAEDPLSKPISYATKAATVGKIVNEVAKKLDVKLEVLPQIKNEVLIVSVDNVTGKQLLDKIAAAAVGVWVRDGETMRLQRNFAQVQREDREALQASAAKVKKQIRDLYDQVNGKAKKPANEEEEAMMQMGMFGGSGSDVKAISSLLMAVDPMLIASLRGDERLVFASPNTRMQRPLTGNVANIISLWVADHNKTAKERENRKLEGDTEIEGFDMKELEEFLKLFGIGEPKTVDERPAKVIMVITKGALGMSMPFMPFGGDSATVELKLYSSKGQVILRGQHQLGFDMSEMMGLAEAMNPEKKEPPKQEENDTKIEYSKATQSMRTIFSDAMQGGPPKLDEELEKMLLRPDEHDPLSFAPSEALLAVAKAKKLNIVASLPDDQISIFGMMLGGETEAATVNAHLRALKEDKSLWVTAEGNWLTITPKNPTAARLTRTNRAALASLLGAIQRNGAATLDDLAAYAQVAESPSVTPAAQLYLMLFAPGAIQQGFAGMTDWDALRFYGTLNMSQKQTIAAGSRLPYSNLTPPQRDLVAKMAFGTSTRLEIGSEKKPEFGGFMALIMQFMPGQDKDYRQEPTEVMPNGLPNEGYIGGSIADQFIGTATGLGPGMGMMDRMPLGVDELAMLEWMRSDPNLSEFTGAMPPIQKLKPGKRTQYRFSFFVAQDVLFSRTLNDDRLDKNAEPIALANLPQEVQDAIKKRVEEYKKSPLPFFGMGGQRPPLP